MALVQSFLGTNTDMASVTLTNSAALMIDRGNQTVTGTLDLSATSSAADVIWGKAATVTFKGASGSPLKLKVNRVFSCNGSGGTLYYTPVATTARFKNINATQVYMGSTGTLTNLECSGASFTSIDETISLANIYVDGGTVVQSYNATGNTLVIVASGSYTTERGINATGSLIQSGGTVTVSRTDSSGTLPHCRSGTISIYGGNFKWRGGNIATLNVYGGTADFSEAPQALTITTLNVTRNSRDASTFKSKFATVTVTTTNVRCAEQDVTY